MPIDVLGGREEAMSDDDLPVIETTNFKIAVKIKPHQMPRHLIKSQHQSGPIRFMLNLQGKAPYPPGLSMKITMQTRPLRRALATIDKFGAGNVMITLTGTLTPHGELDHAGFQIKPINQPANKDAPPE